MEVVGTGWEATQSQLDDGRAGFLPSWLLMLCKMKGARRQGRREEGRGKKKERERKEKGSIADTYEMTDPIMVCLFFQFVRIGLQ